MADLSKSLEAEALESLQSEICPACKRKKVAKQSFCYRCYKLLPVKLQRQLYKSIWDGYAEIWAEAKEELNALL